MTDYKCPRCGKVVQIDPSEMDRIIADAMKQSKFDSTIKKIEVYCDECYNIVQRNRNRPSYIT